MTVSRRTFLRSTTAAGAALGGGVLFATATNFSSSSMAVDALVEKSGQKIPVSDNGFLSVVLPQRHALGERTPAKVHFDMDNGQVYTVDVATPDEGRDDRPDTNVSTMIEVPQGARFARLEGGEKLNFHEYAPTDKPTVGVTPYAATKNQPDLLQLSSQFTQQDLVGSLILGGIVAAAVSGLARGLQNVPNLPHIPSLPNIPGLPPLPQIPGVPGGVSNVINGLNVVSRTGWGANEGLMGWTPNFKPAQMITVHHTAMRTDHNTDFASQVRGIYDYHARQLGWGDIGYHLLIAPNGTVFQGRATGDGTQAVFSRGSTLGVGRPQVVTAGHTYNVNDGNVGVCLLGDFTNTVPTAAAVNSLVRVLGHLCRGMGIDPRGGVRYVNSRSGLSINRRAIVGHRDWGDVSTSTACPGNSFYPQLESIRRRV